MKLSFSFSKKQVTEITLFALIVLGAIALMACTGADFR